MHKLAIVFLLAVFLVGCGDGGNPILANWTLKIERDVKGGENPSLVVFAEKAVLDYNPRVIYVSGVKNIAGESCNLGGWVVKEIAIDQQGNMEIRIPPDAPYAITIGKQEHRLPKIVDFEKGGS